MFVKLWNKEWEKMQDHAEANSSVQYVGLEQQIEVNSTLI